MTTSLNSGIIPELTIGDRCSMARRHTGMDQTEFAAVLESSRRVVSRIETGSKQPTRSEIIAWAFASGVDLHWLSTGETPSPDGDGASNVVRPKGFEPLTFCSGRYDGVTRALEPVAAVAVSGVPVAA